VKHSSGPFPTSYRSQRALPTVRRSIGLRSASQSVMLVQIFVNAPSASNGRYMRGLPNLAATAVRTSRYGTRRPAELSGRASSKAKNTMARQKGKVAFRKGAHHGR
jgi:hypothetical protein